MVCYIVSRLYPTQIVINKIWSQVFLTVMPTIFTVVYQESLGISGLHYIAMGLGLTGASQINARMLDRIYIHFKNKNNGVGEPEFRLRTLQCIYYFCMSFFWNTSFSEIASVFVGAVLLPIGLFISGWAAQAHVHWAVTDLVSWLYHVVYAALNGLLREFYL